MTEKKILVVEDDDKLRSTVADYLSSNGFEVLCAANGVDALKIFFSGKTDLVLLDGMLPDIDGIDVLRKIRESSRAPVIILSARETEEQQLAGFKAGADNYLTKPFLLSVLKEHINALLLRAGNEQNELIKRGELVLDKSVRKVFLAGAFMETTPKEFDVLCYFAENPETVVTRDQILDAVWGYDYFGEFRTVDTIIKQLRKKMTDDYPYIRSVYGVGYFFEAEQ